MMAGDWVEQAGRAAAGVRRRALVHTVRRGEGYLCQACSAAEVLATLYIGVMRLGPSQGPPIPAGFPGVPGAARQSIWGGDYNGPDDPALDRFLLSPAHYALALYATLVETGRLAADALERYNRDGSTVEMIGAEHSPGMETTAGSLGQALSVGVGRALGRKRREAGGRVWVLLSDGEFQEGQTWEALGAAAHYRLDNLGVYVDGNGHQCDGPVERVLGIEPLAAPTRETPDGRPLLVITRTRPWQGIPSLRARAPKFHYVRFRPGEAEQALADLGLTRDEVLR